MIVEVSRLHTIIHTHTHSLLYRSDQLVAEAATCTKHIIQKRKTSTPSAGFEPAIPAIIRPQNYVLQTARLPGAAGKKISEATELTLHIGPLRVAVHSYSCMFWVVPHHQSYMTVSGGDHKSGRVIRPSSLITLDNKILLTLCV